MEKVDIQSLREQLESKLEEVEKEKVIISEGELTQDLEGLVIDHRDGTKPQNVNDLESELIQQLYETKDFTERSKIIDKIKQTRETSLRQQKREEKKVETKKQFSKEMQAKQEKLKEQIKQDEEKIESLKDEKEEKRKLLLRHKEIKGVAGLDSDVYKLITEKNVAYIKAIVAKHKEIKELNSEIIELNGEISKLDNFITELGVTNIENPIKPEQIEEQQKVEEPEQVETVEPKKAEEVVETPEITLQKEPEPVVTNIPEPILPKKPEEPFVSSLRMELPNQPPIIENSEPNPAEKRTEQPKVINKPNEKSEIEVGFYIRKDGTPVYRVVFLSENGEEYFREQVGWEEIEMLTSEQGKQLLKDASVDAAKEFYDPNIAKMLQEVDAIYGTDGFNQYTNIMRNKFDAEYVKKYIEDHNICMYYNLSNLYNNPESKENRKKLKYIKKLANNNSIREIAPYEKAPNIFKRMMRKISKALSTKKLTSGKHMEGSKQGEPKTKNMNSEQEQSSKILDITDVTYKAFQKSWNEEGFDVNAFIEKYKLPKMKADAYTQLYNQLKAAENSKPQKGQDFKKELRESAKVEENQETPSQEKTDLTLEERRRKGLEIQARIKADREKLEAARKSKEDDEGRAL